MADLTTHATLLQRLAGGDDPQAWRDFCDRYGLLIRNVARQHHLQPADCDEVVQEVLLALARHMPGFQYDPARGRFRGYLKTVVLREVYRRLRQKPGATPLENIETADPADSEAEDSLWETEWRQYHLRTAMHTVSTEFAAADLQAFDHYAVQGHDARATAAALGLSVDQVYQAKSRILKRLGEVIEAQVAEEG